MNFSSCYILFDRNLIIAYGIQNIMFTSHTSLPRSRFFKAVTIAAEDLKARRLKRDACAEGNTQGKGRLVLVRHS